jgi:Rod binding domain-containing protein
MTPIHATPHINQNLKTPDDSATRKAIEAKAKEFEEIFIADSLKNAKIGMADSSLVSDTKITDTFSTFMNKALAETIVSQGGFGLTEHITNALIQQQSPSHKPITTPQE